MTFVLPIYRLRSTLISYMLRWLRLNKVTEMHCIQFVQCYIQYVYHQLIQIPQVYSNVLDWSIKETYTISSKSGSLKVQDIELLQCFTCEVF